MFQHLRVMGGVGWGVGPTRCQGTCALAQHARRCYTVTARAALLADCAHDLPDEMPALQRAMRAAHLGRVRCYEASPWTDDIFNHPGFRRPR